MNELTQASIYKKLDHQLEKALKKRVSDISWSIDKTQNVLKEAKQCNYKKGEAYANAYLAFFYMIITKHEEAQPYLQESTAYFEFVKDKKGLAFNYNTIGSIHYKTDDYHFGLKYLLKAYNLYKELDDTLNQARTLKSIGAIYEFFKDYEQAKNTYLKSIKLCESIDDFDGISNALNPLSGIYLKENHVEKATELIDRSVELKQKTNDLRGLAFALFGKAKVHDHENKIKEAEATYLKSLEIHQQLNEHVGEIMTLNKLGNMYLKIGNTKLAEQRLLECTKLGDKTHHNLVIYKSYYSLYRLAKSKNQNDKALHYLELHVKYKEIVQKRDIQHILKSVQSLSKIETLENEAKWQKEKTEEIEKKNKELDNFVYKVSHDLRGPISSLLGLHHVASLDIKDKHALNYLNMYHEQIKRLESIILDFIDLTRLKESQTKLTRIGFDKIISQCINSFNYLPNYNTINFDIYIEKGLQYHSDQSSINSILQNLIENSIKYSDPDKNSFVKISISKEVAASQLCIKVEDNGIGISDNFKSKIFDMFFRANDTVQGSGLGLYILKAAVERVNGIVDFESVEGVGTMFEIKLPYKLS